MTKNSNIQNQVTVGNRIISLRKMQSLTQSGAAQKLYINSDELSRMENDHKIPNTNLLIGMKNLYHTTIEYILFGPDGSSPNIIDVNGLATPDINAILTLVNSLRQKR